MRIMLAAVLFVIFGAIEGKAQLTVKDYRDQMESKNIVLIKEVKMFVRGLGDGIIPANVMAKSPLFCQPEKLALGFDNYLDIIDRQLQQLASKAPKTKLDKFPIAGVLLVGLQDTFPCQK